MGGALDASGATRASATAHDLGALLRTGGAADPLWIRSLGRNASYASQVVYEGLIYNLDAARHLQVLDAADGSEVYRRRLSREEVKPSLAIAGGLLFVTDSEGTTFVLRPGRDHEVIRSNVLEPMRASPLFVGRRMYARTFEHLYCVGGP